MTLLEHIDKLYAEIKELKNKIEDSDKNTDDKDTPTISKVGSQSTKSSIMPISANSGLGAMKGGGVIWNSEELTFTPHGEEVPIPDEKTKSYNTHTHSRYSGGALIVDALEIVEYDWNGIQNKHNLQNLTEEQQPKVKTEINSKNEVVFKIGGLDLIFDADQQLWGSAAYEIDVKKCFLVVRDNNGNIMLDENGNEKCSPLYNTDGTKSAVVWDKNAECWRFYATFASGVPGEGTEEEPSVEPSPSEESSPSPSEE